MEIKITNICSKFQTNCDLDLDELFDNDYYLIFSSKKYDKNKFSALICKYLNTKLTFLIFRTGTVVMVGAKSRKQSLHAANDLVYLLRLLSRYNAIVSCFHVTNYCFSAKLGQSIDLNKMKQDFPKQLFYEIELFINAKFHLNKYKYTITHKGKIFGTGFKNKSLIKPHLKQLITLIKPYYRVNKNAI